MPSAGREGRHAYVNTHMPDMALRKLNLGQSRSDPSLRAFHISGVTVEPLRSYYDLYQ